MSLFRCCVLFTHLAMVHGLQGNNIHFSAAATLCQQIVPHFASQLHGTNLEPLAFALATTIPCWATPCWAIATESCDYKQLFFFPELLLFFSSRRRRTCLKNATRKFWLTNELLMMRQPSLVCNATPELSWWCMMVSDFASQHITTVGKRPVGRGEW